MSWLPNPFKSLQLYGDEQSHYDSGDDDFGSVKEDLSLIGQTISRQLRGVAAFLAPPPASSSTEPSCSSISAVDDSGDSISPTFARIRSDLAELGGSFKSSLTLLSNNKTVAEFSKMASNFLQLDELVEGEEEEEEEEEDDRGVGITDSVLHFVTEISERPECWTDFPLALNHGFSMSKAQAEHVAVIVDLVPSLAELRGKLSSEMTANRFWMIYFILLLPRLNRDSVDLLSTPEIVETRSALLNMLLNKRNSATSESEKDHIDYSFQSDSKHDPNSSGEERADEGDVSHRKLKNEDEFSFSDLEDDETEVSTRRSGKAQGAVSYSSDASSEWVRLNKNVETGGGQSQFTLQNRDSEGDESSDWLTIDDFDNEN